MPASNPNLAPSRPATIEEVSDYLGIAVKTLYQWRWRGKGPLSSRVGNKIRYKWSDVEAWYEAQPKRAA